MWIILMGNRNEITDSSLTRPCQEYIRLEYFHKFFYNRWRDLLLKIAGEQSLCFSESSWSSLKSIIHSVLADEKLVLSLFGTFPVNHHCFENIYSCFELGLEIDII